MLLMTIFPELMMEMKRNVEEQLHVQIDWATTFFESIMRDIENCQSIEDATIFLQKMDRYEKNKTKNASMYDKIKILYA